MLKRGFDVVAAAAGLVLAAPVLLPAMLAVWLQDFRSPFYVAPRTGRNGQPFRMVKLRSMVVGADRSGVDSTSANDTRITAVGRFIRAYKIDELSQLWNVLTGHMSLVGPRPNVPRETDRYTAEERRLLSVKPGITDIASIVFADEGDILAASVDPDLDYNRLIRPWKSRLGLIYVDRASLGLDVLLALITAVQIVRRGWALALVARLARRLGASDELVAVARRNAPLAAAPPPGAERPVTAVELHGARVAA